MRAVLGWLRGEAKHCSMVAIPTLAQEDAKRPNREHEHLVGERTSIVNRMKATMARHGIRGFKLKLRKASEQFAKLRTPEGRTTAAQHPGRAASATWRGCGLCAIRSRQSRSSGWSACARRRRTARIR